MTHHRKRLITTRLWCGLLTMGGTHMASATGPADAPLVPPAPRSPTELTSSIAGGLTHTCMLQPSGSVFCWGYNFSGQLGDGTTTSRPRPQRSAA